jgi:hypothetical protein
MLRSSLFLRSFNSQKRLSQTLATCLWMKKLIAIKFHSKHWLKSFHIINKQQSSLQLDISVISNKPICFVEAFGSKDAHNNTRQKSRSNEGTCNSNVWNGIPEELWSVWRHSFGFFIVSNWTYTRETQTSSLISVHVLVITEQFSRGNTWLSYTSLTLMIINMKNYFHGWHIQQGGHD